MCSLRTQSFSYFDLILVKSTLHFLQCVLSSYILDNRKKMIFILSPDHYLSTQLEELCVYELDQTFCFERKCQRELSLLSRRREMRGVTAMNTYVVKPVELPQRWVGFHDALEVNIVPFFDVLLAQRAAETEFNNGSICNRMDSRHEYKRIEFPGHTNGACDPQL